MGLRRELCKGFVINIHFKTTVYSMLSRTFNITFYFLNSTFQEVGNRAISILGCFIRTTVTSKPGSDNSDQLLGFNSHNGRIQDLVINKLECT